MKSTGASVLAIHVSPVCINKAHPPLAWRIIPQQLSNCPALNILILAKFSHFRANSARCGKRKHKYK